MSNKNQATLDRLIGAYLRPRVYQMFCADAKNKIRSKSSLADDIISKHYESLPEAHQQELLNEYKRLNK
jgi:hypothetical protein